MLGKLVWRRFGRSDRPNQTLCRGVDQTKGLVAAKEKELQAVLPQAQQQASQIDALTGKLGSLQQ